MQKGINLSFLLFPTSAVSPLSLSLSLPLRLHLSRLGDSSEKINANFN